MYINTRISQRSAFAVERANRTRSNWKHRRQIDRERTARNLRKVLTINIICLAWLVSLRKRTLLRSAGVSRNIYLLICLTTRQSRFAKNRRSLRKDRETYPRQRTFVSRRLYANSTPVRLDLRSIRLRKCRCEISTPLPIRLLLVVEISNRERPARVANKVACLFRDRVVA